MCKNRVFILGAGFSKQAGMPLATELLPFIENQFKEYDQDDALAWLGWLKQRINWLEKTSSVQTGSFNIEQIFDLAYFDVMAWRLKHHTCKLGRNAGDVPYQAAEDISAWLSHMEDNLRDIIWDRQKLCQQNVQTIVEFIKHLRPNDIVLTFNYDTLLESCLSGQNIDWRYGFDIEDKKNGIIILKMHGSINWILAPRNKYENFGYLSLFKKEDKNRNDANFPSGDNEWDYVLLQVPDKSVGLRIENRDLQSSAKPFYLAIGGLGRYKPLDEVPGLGEVWVKAMSSLLKAEKIYIVGFSLSAFDTMARLHFAGAMCDRQEKKKVPPNIIVIDPCDKDPTLNFQSVFGSNTPIKWLQTRAENINWAKELNL